MRVNQRSCGWRWRAVSGAMGLLALSLLAPASANAQPPGTPTVPAGAAAAAATPGSDVPVLSPGAAAARYPRNAAEFDELFHKIKNWGRWGKDDQLGAANLITNEKRRSAVKLVKSGIVVSLAHNPLTEAAPDNPSPFEHTMNRGFTTDTYKVSYHGYAHSHLDSLCHILYKDQTYNGHARADINTEKGCTQLGIHSLKNGVVTRGVLVDMARFKNVPYLEPGTPIFVEDLEAWEKKTGIKISAGDAVFIRTGRWARREKLGPWPVARNAAGLHGSVAPWLKERGVSFLGGDAAQDVVPSLVDGITLPIHTLGITALGIDLFDNQDLEAVGAMADKLKRWEFMLSASPVPVTGGTGFPVNALAIF